MTRFPTFKVTESALALALVFGMTAAVQADGREGCIDECVEAGEAARHECLEAG